jgi:hypothetical protein
MSAMDRQERLQRERGKALVRDLHETELRAAGAARALALHQAEQQLDRIARLMTDALKAGLTLAEISRLTNVSRPTLYELRGRYGEAVGDLRFAVLQAVATRAPIWMDELAEHLGHREEIAAVVKDLVREGLIDWDPSTQRLDDAGFPVALAEIGPALEMTASGFETLELWFDAEDAKDEGNEL